MPITSNSRTFDQSSSFKNTYMTPFDEGLSGQANNRKHDMWRDMFAFQDIVKQDKYMNGRDKETARQFTWLLCAIVDRQRRDLDVCFGCRRYGWGYYDVC
jgi:hypothetical protein